MGTSHKDFKEELLKDPEVRKEYEAMSLLLTDEELEEVRRDGLEE